MLQQLALFIHGTKNIVGCLLALGGLTLFFTEIIYDNWFLIICGLYTIGYRLAPAPPKLLQSNQTQLFSSSELLFSLNTLTRKVEKKLPNEMLTLVKQITQEIVDIVRQFSDLKKDIHSHHIIQQTVIDYLPGILETYIKIPPAYRKMYMTKNGDSTTKIAIEQLELLLAQTKKTSTMITNNNINALKAHGRFLKTKFASSNR